VLSTVIAGRGWKLRWSTSESISKRLAVVLTLIGLAVAGVAIGITLHRLSLNDLGGPHGTFDLRVYMAGARAIRGGQNLYGAGFAATSPRGFPFTYPPFAAIVLVGLSYLGFAPLAWGWEVASFAVLAGCVSLAFRPLRTRLGSPFTIFVLSALALLARPVYDDLSLGQVDVLLMGAVMFACASRESRPWRATLVGVAAAIKVVPGIFIVYLLLARRWRMAWAAIGAWAGATALGFALRPHSSVLYYGHLLWEPSRPGASTSFLNQSVWGMVERAHLGSLQFGVIALAVGILAVVGLARAVSAWRQGHTVAAAVLVGLVGVLASPISWIHETVWLVPAVGVLLGDARLRVRGGLPRRRVAALVLAGLLWASLPYVGHGLGHGSLAQLLMDTYGLAAAVLVLAGIGERVPAKEDGTDVMSVAGPDREAAVGQGTERVGGVTTLDQAPAPL
jgi:alpha-1,2-mannosyltransferase